MHYQDMNVVVQLLRRRQNADGLSRLPDVLQTIKNAVHLVSK